jgi:hypothetical protein
MQTPQIKIWRVGLSLYAAFFGISYAPVGVIRFKLSSSRTLLLSLVSLLLRVWIFVLDRKLHHFRLEIKIGYGFFLPHLPVT